MPRSTPTGRLARELAADIAGVPESVYRSWVTRELLNLDAEGGCTELDLVRLVVLKRLTDDLHGQAELAWSQLQELLRSRAPVGRFDLVWVKRDLQIEVVFDEAGLEKSVVDRGPVITMRLAREIERSLDAFRRGVAGTPPTVLAGSRRRNREAQSN